MLVLDKHYDTGLGDKGGQLFDERNLLRWSTFILAFTFRNRLLLEEESKELTACRDFLLPLLINGQVKYKG